MTGAKIISSTSIEPNSVKTLTLLNKILRLFCLSFNVTENFESPLCLIRKILIGAVFGILTGSCLFYKIRHVYSMLTISVILTDTVQSIYDYCQYLVDLFFVYKYGRHVFYEYLKQYTKIDNLMGSSRYCSSIKRRLSKLIAFFIAIWMISSAGDLAAWVIGYGWIIPIVFSLAYVFLLIKILTTLDFTAQVMHIQCRLRTMGDIVQDYYTNADPLLDNIGDAIRNQNWFYSNCCTKMNSDMQVTNMIPKASFKWLSGCYLSITEQCQYINRMFGIRILLNSLSLFIDMVRFTNLAVRIIIGSQRVAFAAGYFPVVSTLARLLTCVAILVSLVDHCEKTYREQERIISIVDHLLINKNPDENLRKAMTELRGLMQTRPVKFHLANFFKLDYTLLVSTASVVVTYTIILLQSMN